MASKKWSRKDKYLGPAELRALKNEQHGSEDQQDSIAPDVQGLPAHQAGAAPFPSQPAPSHGVLPPLLYLQPAQADPRPWVALLLPSIAAQQVNPAHLAPQLYSAVQDHLASPVAQVHPTAQDHLTTDRLPRNREEHQQVIAAELQKLQQSQAEQVARSAQPAGLRSRPAGEEFELYRPALGASFGQTIMSAMATRASKMQQMQQQMQTPQTQSLIPLPKQQNQSSGFRPPLDVGRFRQLINTATMPKMTPQYGPPQSAPIAPDPLWLEWKQVEANLKRFPLGREGNETAMSPMNSFDDYKAHKFAFDQQMAEEDALSDANQASWDEMNKRTGRKPFEYADIPAPNNGTSTVLGVPTIWTGVHMDLNPNREAAPWPTQEEFREEGDERHTSQFGRFLPVPRFSSNSTVNYKQAKYMPSELLDRVCPVPSGRRFHQGLFYDRAGIPYDDDRMCGREAVAFADDIPFGVDELNGQHQENLDNEDISKAVVLRESSVDRDRLISELTSGQNKIISRAERRERRRKSKKAQTQSLSFPAQAGSGPGDMMFLESGTMTGSSSTVTTPFNGPANLRERSHTAPGAGYLPFSQTHYSHSRGQSQNQASVQSLNRNAAAGNALANARFSNPSGMQSPAQYENSFQPSQQDQQLLYNTLQQQEQSMYDQQVSRQISQLPPIMPQSAPTRGSALTTLRNQTATRIAAANKVKVQDQEQRRQQVESIVAAHKARTANSSTAPMVSQNIASRPKSSSNTSRSAPKISIAPRAPPSYAGKTAFSCIGADGQIMRFEPSLGRFVTEGYTASEAAASVNGSSSERSRAGSSSPEKTYPSLSGDEHDGGDEKSDHSRSYSGDENVRTHAGNTAGRDYLPKDKDADSGKAEQLRSSSDEASVRNFDNTSSDGENQHLDAQVAQQYQGRADEGDEGDYDHEVVASVLKNLDLDLLGNHN